MFDIVIMGEMIVEIMLFLFSWTAQRSFVFKKKGLTADEQK